MLARGLLGLAITSWGRPFVKARLMQRLGVMAIDWIEPTPGPIERYENLNLSQVEKLLIDQDRGLIQIVEGNERPADIPESFPGGVVFDVGYRRRSLGRVQLQSIRPGNFFFSSRLRTSTSGGSTAPRTDPTATPGGAARVLMTRVRPSTPPPVLQRPLGAAGIARPSTPSLALQRHLYWNGIGYAIDS